MPAPTTRRSRRAFSLRLGRIPDGTLEVAVASLAVWTVLKALAMLWLPLPAAHLIRSFVTLAFAVWRATRHWLPSPDDTEGRQTWAAVGVAGCTGVSVHRHRTPRPRRRLLRRAVDVDRRPCCAAEG